MTYQQQNTDQPKVDEVLSDVYRILNWFSTQLSSVTKKISENMDWAVAKVYTLTASSHARQHSITSTADHTSTSTQNKVQKANVNGHPVDSTIIDDGTDVTLTGKLGVGSTSLVEKVTVSNGSANTYIRVNCPTGSYAAGIMCKESDTSGGVVQWIAQGYGAIPTRAGTFEIINLTNNDITFRPFDAEQMRIKADGRVGIGTDAPSHKLTISAATGNEYATVKQDATHSVELGWIYDATPANAYAVLDTYGYNNALCIDAAILYLQKLSGGETRAGAAANYTKWLSDGTQHFVGTAHLPYGSMYIDDGAGTVSVSASGTYYYISGLTDGGSNGFTFQNNRELKCLVAGKYKVDWSMSISSIANNEQIAGAVMVNTTAASNTEGMAQCINSGKNVCVAGSGIVTLAVDDLVRLSVENEDAAHNITVSHATLSIVMVGG